MGVAGIGISVTLRRMICLYIIKILWIHFVPAKFEPKSEPFPVQVASQPKPPKITLTHLYHLRDQQPHQKLHPHQRWKSPARITIYPGIKGKKVAKAIRVPTNVSTSHQGQSAERVGHNNLVLAEKDARVRSILHADSVSIALNVMTGTTYAFLIIMFFVSGFSFIVFKNYWKT